MPVDVQQPRSRRALLAGLAGAAGAAMASFVAQPGRVRAGVDGDVVLGAPNSELTATEIHQTAADEVGFIVTSLTGSGDAMEASSAVGAGVLGGSQSGPGVHGVSGSGPGVRATSQQGPGLIAEADNFDNAVIIGLSQSHNCAIAGYLADTPFIAPPQASAVYGDATSEDTGTGVWGKGATTDTSNSAGLIGEGDVGVIGSAVGIGVLGETFADGVGVYGSASNSATPSVFVGTGVTGQSDAKTGVLGFTGTTAPAPAGYTGLYGVGVAGGTAGRGVYGYAPTGTGMQGQSASGTGVKAVASDTGFALRVLGKAGFTRSGKTVVTAGHSNVVKTSIALTSSSFVIATLQTNVAGLFIQAVVTNPAGSKFTIYLNKAPAVNVAVAWLVVN